MGSHWAMDETLRGGGKTFSAPVYKSGHSARFATTHKVNEWQSIGLVPAGSDKRTWLALVLASGACV